MTSEQGTRRRHAVAFAVVVAVGGGLGSPAAACSCGMGDPRAILGRVDAAIVGTVVSSRDGGAFSGGTDLVFRVEEWVKGGSGAEVAVHGPHRGSSCALTLSPGTRVGLLLDRADDRWQAGSCDIIDIDVLRRAAAPLPSPDGEPPARLLVGGGFGKARTLALDAHGRTVAYGYGAGHTLRQDVCPGGQVSVEVARTSDRPRRTTLALRRTSDMAVVREVALPSLHGDRPSSLAHVMALGCRDPVGEDVLAFAFREDPPVGTLLRIVDTAVSVVMQGTFRGAALPPGDVVYLAGGAAGQSLVAYDVASQTTRVVAALPNLADRYELVHHGDRVAGLTLTWPEAEVFVVDVTSGTTRRASVPASRGVAWADDGRIVVSSSDEVVLVFDGALRRAGSWTGFGASNLAVLDGVLYGAGPGKVLSASPASGPAIVLRELDSHAVFSLVTVPTPDPAVAVPPATFTDPVQTPHREPVFVAEGGDESAPLGARVRSAPVTGAFAALGLAAAAVFAFRRRRGGSGSGASR